MAQPQTDQPEWQSELSRLTAHSADRAIGAPSARSSQSTSSDWLELPTQEDLPALPAVHPDLASEAALMLANAREDAPRGAVLDRSTMEQPASRMMRRAPVDGADCAMNGRTHHDPSAGRVSDHAAAGRDLQSSLTLWPNITVSPNQDKESFDRKENKETAFLLRTSLKDLPKKHLYCPRIARSTQRFLTRAPGRAQLRRPASRSERGGEALKVKHGHPHSWSPLGGAGVGGPGGHP